MTQDERTTHLATEVMDPPEAMLLAWIHALGVVRQGDLMQLQRRSASVISRQINSLLQQGLLKRHRVALGKLGRPVDFFTLPHAPPPTPEQLATLDQRLAMLRSGTYRGAHDGSKELRTTPSSTGPTVLNSALATAGSAVTATNTGRTDEGTSSNTPRLHPVTVAHVPPPGEPSPFRAHAPTAGVEVPPVAAPEQHEQAEREPQPPGAPAAPSMSMVEAEVHLPPPPWGDVRASRPSRWPLLPRMTHDWLQNAPQQQQQTVGYTLPSGERAILITTCVAIGIMTIWFIAPQLPGVEPLLTDIPTALPTLLATPPSMPVTAPTPLSGVRPCATVTGTGGVGVVVRETPAGRRVGAIPEGAIVEITGEPQTITHESHQVWVPVRRASLAGWSSQVYLLPTDCEATP